MDWQRMDNPQSGYPKVWRVWVSFGECFRFKQERDGFYFSYLAGYGWERIDGATTFEEAKAYVETLHRMGEL